MEKISLNPSQLGQWLRIVPFCRIWYSSESLRSRAWLSILSNTVASDDDGKCKCKCKFTNVKQRHVMSTEMLFMRLPHIVFTVT